MSDRQVYYVTGISKSDARQAPEEITIVHYVMRDNVVGVASVGRVVWLKMI